MPGIADNALVKAARLIERLAAYRPEPSIGPEVAGFLDAVLGEQPRAGEVLDAARAPSTRSRSRLIEPLLSLHALADDDRGLRAAERHPRHVRGDVDRRLLPGQTPEDVEPIVRGVARRRATTTSRRSSAAAARAPRSTRRSGARSRPGSSEIEPGAALAPICCAGFTDSHWLREAFGTVAYGFFPMRTMEPELAARLIHSADERMHVDDLELGVEFLRAAARSLA